MSKQPADPQTTSLGYWVFRLNRAMHTAFSERLAHLGVTTAEWTALGRVSQGGVTPVTLADHMGIDRAAVTRIIDQLEAKTLLKRTKHPTDGRSTILELTSKGSKLLPKLIAESVATNQMFLKTLSDQEASTLLTLIRKLAEHIPARVYPFDL